MKLFIWLVFVVFAFCVGLYFNTAHELPFPIAILMMVICGALMGRGLEAYMEDF